MLFVSLNDKRARARCCGLRDAQAAILSWRTACSLAATLSKLVEMANHLFFWAAFNWAQWGAKGNKAFLCKAVKFCQADWLGEGVAAAGLLEEEAAAEGLDGALTLVCAQDKAAADPTRVA